MEEGRREEMERGEGEEKGGRGNGKRRWGREEERGERGTRKRGMRNALG